MREFEGMLIGKNALRHYVGGKTGGKVTCDNSKQGE